MKDNKFCIKKITVESYQSGQRIDNFLIKYFKNIPKSVIYRMIRKKIIKINKKKTKPFYKVENKDEISLPSLQVKKKVNTLYNIDKIQYLTNKIIYEDECILAINKPSGIAVHGGSGINYGIIESLRILRPELKFLELVHRLDRDTSGILLMAKKCSVLRFLNMQLFEKKMKKKYTALVHGIWPNFVTTVKEPLVKKNNKIVYINNLGKTSETKFEIHKKYEKLFTLMKITPITGRTHQIRVHALHIGCPIVFDSKYGYKNIDKKIKFSGINRLFLHASSLSFIHPRTKKLFIIKAHMEKSLQNFLVKLNNKLLVKNKIS